MSGIDLIQDLGLVMLITAAAAWICQRIGLPVVIGYITAGILIGPHTHLFALISDAGPIQSLAQIGLVFLIFSIGQGIKLQRLKKVGLPLVLATVIIAVMVLVGCRLLGAALGWPGEYSLVLGGMLMVSSTAVLGKSLLEANATHSRFGQTALTVTALDDLVAVVTLTVLISIIQVGQADSMAVLGTVVRLKAVIITMAIGGYFPCGVLPRWSWRSLRLPLCSGGSSSAFTAGLRSSCGVNWQNRRSLMGSRNWPAGRNEMASGK